MPALHPAQKPRRSGAVIWVYGEAHQKRAASKIYVDVVRGVEHNRSFSALSTALRPSRTVARATIFRAPFGCTTASIAASGAHPLQKQITHSIPTAFPQHFHRRPLLFRLGAVLNVVDGGAPWRRSLTSRDAKTMPENHREGVNQRRACPKRCQPTAELARWIRSLRPQKCGPAKRSALTRSGERSTRSTS
jgi:hypothetical protein